VPCCLLVVVPEWDFPMILTYHKRISLSLMEIRRDQIRSTSSSTRRSAVSKVLGVGKKQIRKQNKIVGMCCLQVHIFQWKLKSLYNKGCVTLWPCHLCSKSILMQTKNYENSNTSSCENIIFKKSSKRNQNPSRYYNFVTNLKFQHKPKYHLPKILI